MKEISKKNINSLLGLPMTIPDYQRSYNWSTKSVRNLLNDILDAYKQYRNNHNYKYRIGTIILYKPKVGKYEIVDGQQRIITLLLIKYCLNNNYSNNLLKEYKTSNKESIVNFRKNYITIDNWLSSNNKKEVQTVIDKVLEVLVVRVDNIDESFQLFDSQNSSGKKLNPHDLLKAFHLREMAGENDNNIRGNVKKWEDRNSKDISQLFQLYLYPIKCWSSMYNTHIFSEKDIDTFKGITNEIKNNDYNYYLPIKSGQFQMDLPFYSGNDFFKMVNYYLEKQKELFEKLNKEFYDISSILNFYFWKKIDSARELSEDVKEVIKIESIGMKYTCQLFFAALFYYYDRFNRIDPIVVQKLFAWAFMLRVNLEMVNMKSINLYGLGLGDNTRIKNKIPMFNLISKYSNYYDIYDLEINVTTDKEENWKALHNIIKKYNGGYLNGNDK